MTLPGVFVKIGDFVKYKGFLVEFLENRRPRENQNPQKIARKIDFSEPRLYNAPSLHSVDKQIRQMLRDKFLRKFCVCNWEIISDYSERSIV